jgi:hypothetical protein
MILVCQSLHGWQHDTLKDVLQNVGLDVGQLT